MHLSGSPWDYLFVFLAGVALSFTPCVYPLIPVTVSYIGASGSANHRKGFLLSLVYVTGIAVTYALLGLVAALTGTLFGKISAHPLTSIVVGLTFIVFGLSMLDVFMLYLPKVVKLAAFAPHGYRSVFLLGMMSGFGASPCVAPALGAILVYITTTGNIFYGVTLLLAFAYGMGFVLLVVGTFSRLLLKYPRSGRWMVAVERLCACVLIAMGLYFMYQGIRRLSL